MLDTAKESHSGRHHDGFDLWFGVVCDDHD